MRCPYCGGEATQVKDSRPVEENQAIRRRRQCPDCGGRFTTHERVQLRELTVLKRSGRKVPFDRDKLLSSVVIALRKRPVEHEQIERMVSGIVRQLESRGDQDISSVEIGEAVMEALRGLDPVGYVRFASVYRDFREAADFEGVLGEIARDAIPPPAEPWLEEERERLAAAARAKAKSTSNGGQPEAARRAAEADNGEDLTERAMPRRPISRRGLADRSMPAKKH